MAAAGKSVTKAWLAKLAWRSSPAYFTKRGALVLPGIIVPAVERSLSNEE